MLEPSVEATQATRATQALQALAERYWQFLRHEFPLGACLAGDPPEDPVMFREAPADFHRRALEAKRLRGELLAIPTAGLASQDRITHRLLQRELEDLHTLHETGSHLRPWLLPVGPEFNTLYFANTTELSGVEDARRFGARLATLPGYFDDVRACLQQGLEAGIRMPRVVLEAAVANLRAAARTPAAQTAWVAPFQRSPAAAWPEVQAEAARATKVVERAIVPALHALADFMSGTLLPEARETVACTEGPNGDAFYAFWVRHFTTLELDPEAVHALGLGEVARLHQEIAQVASRAGYTGNVAAYRRFLNEDPAFRETSAERLRERVEALAKRIDGRIPSLIGHLPRASYGVQSIPAVASEKLPMAYAQPSPADGSSAGFFWVSGLPERVPTYALVSVTLHEAWPGHLMHIALMQELSGLPAFRRANFTKYTACLEGWAMYCETLGHELGLYETPHQHFGQLDMEMWRACRLVVDTGIHARGWSREQAIAYMADHLSLPLPAIRAEVDRYIAMPAQALAYQLGGLKFRELRGRAQARLGERFKLRDYHDQLMAAGAVTLPVLEEVVDDWLGRHAA
ncbi:MAG: hypothetical protein RI988_2660 [Pseudomonadota bacterium]|jgi:uncharacterized protein (DUF885 family)